MEEITDIIEITDSDATYAPVLSRYSSEEIYRGISDNIRIIERTKTLEYSITYGVSFETAQQKLQQDPWNQEILVPDALTVGEVIITSSIPQTLTNSPIPNGVYLDTFAIIMLDNEMIAYCTYNDMFNKLSVELKHSGDIMIQTWLRHIIDLPNNNELDIYICTAGWIQGKASKLITFAELDPILEIRSIYNDVKKRQIISTGFAESEEHTAMINAHIHFQDGSWKCKIMREFCMGFVGDLNPIVNKIKTMT